jgi:putative transposase
MDEKMRQRIALFRFSVIGPLISGELMHGELNRRIQELSVRTYSVPHGRRTRVRAGTIEEWLYTYRKFGLDGLKPKSRSDTGTIRAVSDDIGKAIIGYRQRFPRMPLKVILYRLVSENKIKPLEVPLSTAYRFLSSHVPKRTAPATGKEQKRFCHRYPNDCWQGDTMHGPYIKDAIDKHAKKTYLIAFIDDATRLIVGAEFFFSEAVANVKDVLRVGVLTYGVPSKLYLDNGKNFCADDIELACAAMQCALIHTTAYYPEGKGKIERFFRTVRDSFLSGIEQIHSLEQLNQNFDDWLQQHYNRGAHSSLDGATPLSTFLKNAENRIRRLPSHIDPAELFCKKESRQVAKDGTFRINNILYETEEHLIGSKIDVLYDKDDPLKKVKVFDGSLLVHTVKPIDFIANSKTKRKELNTSQGNSL